MLDIFAGSGTTAIAAELNGLRARLVELDAGHCDVIIRRWQEFVQREAIRKSDDAKFDELAKGKSS